MAKIGDMKKFRTMVSLVLEAVGVQDSDIILTMNGISIVSYGIIISIVKNDQGKIIWKVTETHRQVMFGKNEEQEISTVLFESAWGTEWYMLKRIAMKIAEIKIDSLIDSAQI